MIILTRVVIALCILAAFIRVLHGEWDEAAYIIIALIGSLDVIVRLSKNMTGNEPNEGDEEDVDEEK